MYPMSAKANFVESMHMINIGTFLFIYEAQRLK